jgi:membrane-associated HD superfamily phosphohydrolase
MTPPDHALRRTLAKCYWIYAGLVGVLFFLVALIGTQGAHSEAEAVMVLFVAAVTPIPMVIMGFAASRGWRRFVAMAMAFAVVLGLCLLPLLLGERMPMSDRGMLAQFGMYLCVGQATQLPGAVMFAALALGLAARDQRRAGK